MNQSLGQAQEFSMDGERDKQAWMNTATIPTG